MFKGKGYMLLGCDYLMYDEPWTWQSHHLFTSNIHPANIGLVCPSSIGREKDIRLCNRALHVRME